MDRLSDGNRERERNIENKKTDKETERNIKNKKTKRQIEGKKEKKRERQIDRLTNRQID